jgi:hypothetical protein
MARRSLARRKRTGNGKAEPFRTAERQSRSESAPNFSNFTEVGLSGSELETSGSELEFSSSEPEVSSF